ncbi:glutathione S-transferase N-terminal domain-containing protein [Lysobacter antibioticus]|uniref:Glutathione S-transferase, N-terminal domain protein n=1 Tax=Lysobacter antibioticus TaxID=84531 RepID=A0A0S2FBQ0_LYSAN|nr:glutathione S-transferase N-terminal domain-containing protein [Lysobacter antibioticus]ALN80975.1 glutathione S-transferase, N-terminal domain protein [Lysobacter antibioticus]
MQADSAVTLVGESFSPWTQKARWALEYCGLPFAYREYTPTLSEPWLRWRMRQWTGAVSVPVLLTDVRVLRGSWDIARHADTHAGDGRLGDFAAIEAWNQLSEAALAEIRTRVVRGVLASPLALDEALAGLLPPPLRTPLRFVARDAARRLDRKYRHLLVPGSLRRALERLREGLHRSGSGYLFDRFGYADISMAVVLEGIAPSARTEPPLGPAHRRCWSDPQLADEFADLLDWRASLARSPTTSYSQLSAIAD